MAKKQRRPKFGALVRKAWEKSGMTQGQFADALGVSQPRVAEIFKQPSMTEALLERCAKALGVEIDIKLVRRRG